jgi:hypothetical protein
MPRCAGSASTLRGATFRVLQFGTEPESERSFAMRTRGWSRSGKGAVYSVMLRTALPRRRVSTSPTFTNCTSRSAQEAFGMRSHSNSALAHNRTSSLGTPSHPRTPQCMLTCRERGVQTYRLGSALVEEVEQRGRQGGAAGLMLTVHLANESARRFYTDKLHFEVSPISPASCAPPVLAAGCDYEVLQRLWDLAARSRLQKRGAEARRELYTREIEQGRLKVSLVMKRGGATGEAASESVGAAESWQRKKSRR